MAASDRPASPRRPWVVLILGALAAAYGAHVAYLLIDTTFIEPRAFGGAFWLDALYVTSGVLAAAIAWGVLPQSMADQLTVALSIPIRIAAIAGFWVSIITAVVRLARRFF